MVASAIDERAWDSCVFCPGQDVGLGIVGQDEHDLCGEASLLNGVEDGLHVGAGAGAENAEMDHGGSLAGGTRAENPEITRTLSFACGAVVGSS